MFDKPQRIIVSGGNGFIGKYFVSRLLEDGHEVFNLDKLTYAADKRIQSWFYSHSNYSFLHGDVAEINNLPECDIIVNFAAETHVDNSIRSSKHFTLSNVIGVQNILDLMRTMDEGMRPYFVQISTDEVYGDIVEGKHFETDALNPSNPYAASKAAAEHILKSYARTYDLGYKIVRMSNNYGNRQFPEKLIPRSVLRLLGGRPAQLHGDGSYIRAWLHVRDAIEAILLVVAKGEMNSIYNIASDEELSNNQVIEKVLDMMGLDFESWVEYIPNRPGQDLRYALDTEKITSLSWKPMIRFEDGLGAIIDEMKHDPHWGGTSSNMPHEFEQFYASGQS